MTIRIPKGYCFGREDNAGVMDENNPANNFYFYVHTYDEYLECREARWKTICRKIVTKS